MIQIFVEGIADVKFLEDYISHIFPKKDKEISIKSIGGWTNFKNVQNELKRNSDENGVNLIVFDADKDFSARKTEIEQWQTDKNLNFELFLFPNNNDSGALEELLERIILDKNHPIFDCWEDYENCLRECASKEIGKPLTTPAKKTKIYGYLEALLGDTKKEKEQIKEKERNYKNTDHWNLDAEYLQPLKEFLKAYLK